MDHKGDISPCIMDLEFKEMTAETVGKFLKSAFEQYYLKEAKSHPNKEKVINLSYNSLDNLVTDNIPDIVQRLLVNVNKLQCVPKLKNNSNLIELSLSFNEISNIEVDCLPLQLQTLKLNGNKIKVVPNLQKLKKLKVLQLKKNEIESIDGLPDSIESLELDGNPIVRLGIDCFPNQKVYNVVKSALIDGQVKGLQYPTPVTFQKGYSTIMMNFLTPLKKKLNKLFAKHSSLKVQGVYIDRDHHKIVVNVKEGQLKRVNSMIDEHRPYVEVIEQPNSPRLLSGNTVKSGSTVQIQANNTKGTIAAKVVDNKGNIYALTCKHIFSNEHGAQRKTKTNISQISAITENRDSVSMAREYYGILGGHKNVPVDDSEDEFMVDVALVPISKETDLSENFNGEITDNSGNRCYLHLYKGEEFCSEDLDSSKVCKFGAQSGYTTGIIFTNNFTYYYKKDDQSNSEALDVILIKGQSNNGEFLQDGDSGALITTGLKPSVKSHDSVQNHAIGLAMADHKDMNVLAPKDECGDKKLTKVQAAIAVKLHICLDALEQKFEELQGLKICCNEDIIAECPQQN